MIVMSESACGDEPRTRWKEAIKKQMVDLYSAALVGGQRHVEYLVELGMQRDRIFTGYDVVDNAYFARRAVEIRNSHLRRGYGGQAAFEIRKKYGLPENYFLASARFIEKKNLLRLIRAYAEYRQLCRASVSDAEKSEARRNAPWDLVLLGDGPLREALNAQLSSLNLHAYVHLPGFKQFDELPVYYALAKAFVHESTTEQWGLVVNEAIASGLPVIVSDRCGCVPELVNGNGFTFDPLDEQELAARLLEMASLSEHDLECFAEASRGIAARFGPDRFGEGLESAAMTAINLQQKRFGLMDRALLFAAARYGR
jgi:glycosyltransferase involved in cell wall biosynthesis